MNMLLVNLRRYQAVHVSSLGEKNGKMEHQYNANWTFPQDVPVPHSVSSSSNFFPENSTLLSPRTASSGTYKLNKIFAVVFKNFCFQLFRAILFNLVG